MREIMQNNSPRWLETVGYYISPDDVEGNVGTDHLWEAPIKSGTLIQTETNEKKKKSCIPDTTRKKIIFYLKITEIWFLT